MSFGDGGPLVDIELYMNRGSVYVRANNSTNARSHRFC